jgi:hypothetical protein
MVKREYSSAAGDAEIQQGALGTSRRCTGPAEGTQDKKRAL